MGPDQGTARYEEQAEQVRAFLRNAEARTSEDEDAIIVLFATDASYSRAAIMDGVGRHRSDLRAALGLAPASEIAKRPLPGTNEKDDVRPSEPFSLPPLDEGKGKEAALVSDSGRPQEAPSASSGGL